MYTRFKQVLDITANIACVIIAGFIVTALALQFVHARAGTETHTVSDGLRVGAAFPPIPGFDYKQHQKSILFFVSPDCSHCVQSLPTYQRLFDKAKALATGAAQRRYLDCLKMTISMRISPRVGSLSQVRQTFPFTNTMFERHRRL
jgi:hypothetical protein